MNFLVMLDIVRVTPTATIRVSANDTGRVVSMVDTRLEGKLSTVLVQKCF